MSSKKIPLFLLAALAAVISFGFIKADDDPLKKIATQLQKWMDNYPQEKVYLHMDKPYYAVGDDIWFKAYVTVGPKHQLSALNGALNVELIDPRDSVKQLIKLPLVNGVAFGDFALADTLEEGNYRIRAYTEWMRNFSPDFFFDKTITIGSAIHNPVYTKANYTFVNSNGQQGVTANINFSDINGIVYAGKAVSYQVQMNMRDIGKGKSVTDDKGNISIHFVNTVPAVQKSGRIIAQIKLSDKQTITRIIPIKATSDKVDVQFFPESGYLVTGLPSKVAFKAVGADGLGKNVKGVITDDAGQEIATFESQHLGMGVFVIVPEAGKTYKAKVTFDDGSTSTLNLPAIQQQGYVLSTNSVSDPDNISVRITASPSLTGSEINLVAQANGQICYAAKNKLQEGVLVARIPKSKFPSGIAQFTLFNAAGEPVNERLVFVNRADLLKIGVSSSAQTYAPRQKVALQLSANDPDGQPELASLSAAVIDATKIPSDESDETSILSEILLSSDIKGYIEKPNYYFTNTNRQTQSDLDVLMMTQGYRRFEWKQILNDVYPPVVFQPQKTLQISGHVHKGKQPVVHGKVMLFATAGGTFVLDTLTDDKGNFVFNNLVFQDSVKFLIQARDEKGRKFVDIDLDNITPQALSPNVNAADVEVNVSSKLVPYLQSSDKLYQAQVRYGVGNHTIMLKEVTVTEKKKPLQNSSNLNGPGNADQIIKSDELDRLGGCADLTICLQGLIHFVTFRGGVPYSTRSPNTPMTIFVDGMEMDADYLQSIPSTMISSIEVLRTGANLAIYGSRGGGGVLIINTKRGNEVTNTPFTYAPGIMTYRPKGYYRARTFYSPQYDDPKTNTTLADLRTTIFWKPNIVTDKDGKASIEFYNAGSPGTYRVVVEGIDSEGHVGHQVYRYKVE